MMRLVKALGTHVELEPGSATQNIGEMVTLCHGLLTSDISGDRLADSIVDLSHAVGLASEGSSMGDTLDEVVDYMREAINMCPSGCPRTSMALGETLTHRFFQKKSLVSSDWKSGLKTTKRPRLNRTRTDQDRKFPGPTKTVTVVRSSVFHNFGIFETIKRPV